MFVSTLVTKVAFAIVVSVTLFQRSIAGALNSSSTPSKIISCSGDEIAFSLKDCDDEGADVDGGLLRLGELLEGFALDSVRS